MIHHLNCATMRPFGFVMSDTATLFSRANLVVHCLLVETDDGLILVDSGFGVGDRTRPTLYEHVFLPLSGASRDLGETALCQVTELGYAVEDVRHIVQTHLHLDHAGGLPDFPDADVHVHAREHAEAMHPHGLGKLIYQRVHWSHRPNWILHAGCSRQWFGFDAIEILGCVSPTVLLIPLPGHTPGHCGVAVEADNGWLLHCGDAYISRADLHPEEALHRRPAWMRSYLKRAFVHVTRLRSLETEHGDEVTLFCTHDARELARFTDQSSSEDGDYTPEPEALFADLTVDDIISEIRQAHGQTEPGA